ncbi:MAG: sugar phosphate isomerase/epimerase [Lachnospiraceae bacterium]|nr:sugar phosphate isomerase/epimerase [Lachnospiraceae bacterium]
MYQFPIGAIVDCFGLELHEAIKTAARIGANGLQMYSTTGANSPENLVGQKRKDLLSFVKDNGLVFSAICGDLGQGFMHREKNPMLIEKSKRIMDLAKDLESDVVTTHIGVVPADRNHERYKIMQEACFELAQYADSMGSHFAIETGPETAAVLKAFLDDLGSTGVAVNLDPANLVMVTGDDPVAAVYTLQKYIVHTHAKDGVNLRKCDPEIIYRAIEHDNWDNEPSFKEVPLGQGSVDFPKYMKALEDIGYKGFLTIERECGKDPAADITMAADFLRQIMKNN